MVVMPEDIEELEKLYKVAVRDDMDTFKFRGMDMDTKYVKYLLEYLKGLK